MPQVSSQGAKILNVGSAGPLPGYIAIFAEPNTSAVSQQREYHRYLLLCAAIIALSLVFKLPSLRYPRQEGDEQTYWHLRQNWLDNGTCSLQGTPILEAPPPACAVNGQWKGVGR